jgi:hypothetical protein
LLLQHPASMQAGCCELRQHLQETKKRHIYESNTPK